MGTNDTSNRTARTPRKARSGLRARMSGDARAAASHTRIADAALTRAEDLSGLTDDELRTATDELRTVAAADGVDSVVVDGLAIASVLATRHLGLTPYRVQMIGAAALLSGTVAQMATGEGKTLVAMLAAFTYSLEGRGCHVITPNDYLAARDGAAAAPMFAAVGATVGVLADDIMESAPRRAQHASSVTYGSDSGFVFDYLRDHTFAAAEDQLICAQGQTFAIIDEVDAVLIDHARTPLVLSSDAEQPSVDWNLTAAAVASLSPGTHVVVDRAERAAHLTDAGIDALEAYFGIDTAAGGSLYSPENAALNRGVYHSLLAQFVFAEGVDYIVTGSGDTAEASIIDPTTGRVMPDNVWSNGLHQAVEASLGLRVRPETQTWARISYQAFFRLYERVCGMSGTAITEAEEFARTFGLGCVEIPTNRPSQRIDVTDQVFATKRAKIAALVRDIEAAHATGRPVLVGAATVESSEEISEALTDAGVPHLMLNARTPETEAAVISAAGTPGAVTVSTAMAGRGTDILLGGDPDRLAEREIEAAGVDPDSPEADTIRAEVAARCESDAAAARAAGGLLVLGAERFEARRVDLQLRGRAGRQGDPGESRFFVSSQDDMVAVFGKASQIISTIVSDSRPVSSKAITKMVERAQAAVEGKDAASRKSLLDWDAPLNGQRNEFYANRDRWVRRDGVIEFTLAAVPAGVRRMVEMNTADGQLPIERLMALTAEYGLSDERAAELIEGPLAGPLDEFAESGDIDGTVDVLSDLVTELITSAVATVSEGSATEALAQVLLHVADREWREHLAHLEHVGDAVKLRAPAGTPPQVIWVQEAAEAFEDFYVGVSVEVVRAAVTLREDPADPMVGGRVITPPTAAPADGTEAVAEGAAGADDDIS